MAAVGADEAGEYWGLFRSWAGEFALEVQAPWAERLVLGEKGVETRHYPFPPHLHHRDLLVVESSRRVKSQLRAGEPGLRVIGTVAFSATVRYTSEAEWNADFHRHLVPASDRFSFANTRYPETYGWEVERVTAFPAPTRVPRMTRVVHSIFRVHPAPQQDEAAR